MTRVAICVLVCYPALCFQARGQAGTITTVAGKGTVGFAGDGGPATSASFYNPIDVVVDGSGNLFISDSLNFRIRKVSASGIIATVAGSGPTCGDVGSTCIGGFSGDGGPATSALLSPSGIAVDAAGNIFIADSNNNRIRKVSASGIITTVAGSGSFGLIPTGNGNYTATGGFAGDGGPATSALLSNPTGVAVDAAGNLFIADSFNYRIRKVSASGIITTIAGNGTQTFSGAGGPATSASFDPAGVALDTSGNLFIADGFNMRVLKVSAAGIITIIAGNGASGFSGDGGPATSASLEQPAGVAVDGYGDLFIADSYNNRLRRVSTGGIITTVAGSGGVGFSGGPPMAFSSSDGDGGPATSATLLSPGSVTLDSSGNLFIADTSNQRIREVSALSFPSVPANGSITWSFENATLVHGGKLTGSFDFDATTSTITSVNLANTQDGTVLPPETWTNATLHPGTGYATPTAIQFVNNDLFGITLDFSSPLGNSGGTINLAQNASLITDLRAGKSDLFQTGEVTAAVPSSPSVPATAVTDSAGFSARIAAGGIASLFGANLAATTASSPSVPLQTTLGGTTVTMNGIPVPLFFISAGQINFQVPWELLSSPTATLTATMAGGTSSPITLSLSPAAPGIFAMNTANSPTQGVIVIANTATFVAPAGAISGNVSRPAITGDVLTIYCAGLGAVTNTPATGSAGGTGNTLSTVQSPVTVAVGSQTASVLFAGLAPGFVGLYQVNVELPAGVTPGNTVPVIVTTANLSSNTATIAVQ